jgi:hypothetical protein
LDESSVFLFQPVKSKSFCQIPAENKNRMKWHQWYGISTASIAFWDPKGILLGIPNPYRKHQGKYEKQKGMVIKMRKPKLVVYESYSGKQRSEDIFAAVFLSTTGLTKMPESGMMK